MGNIIRDTEDSNTILREYFKNLYSIKLDNLKEMDDFLDSAKHPKLNQYVNNLNIPIKNEKIEIVRKSLPAKKVQGQIYS